MPMRPVPPPAAADPDGAVDSVPVDADALAGALDEAPAEAGAVVAVPPPHAATTRAPAAMATVRNFFIAALCSSCDGAEGPTFERPGSPSVVRRIAPGSAGGPPWPWVDRGWTHAVIVPVNDNARILSACRSSRQAAVKPRPGSGKQQSR